MSDLHKGYKYVCCPTHTNKKLGQVKVDAKLNGEVLMFCSLCKHVVEIKTEPTYQK